MQKTMIQAFTVDEWASSDAPVIEGVSRVPVPAYRLADAEEPIVIMQYTEGRDDSADATSNVFTVETRVVSDTDLNNTLAVTVQRLGAQLVPVPIHADRVKDYMTQEKLAHLFCHPEMKLPEGLSAVRNTNFPKPESEDTYDVYACTQKAGIIVSVQVPATGNRARGFFLRSLQFRRIHMMAPVPSALDFILGDEDDD